jgi:hypothetical protein
MAKIGNDSLERFDRDCGDKSVWEHPIQFVPVIPIHRGQDTGPPADQDDMKTDAVAHKLIEQQPLFDDNPQFLLGLARGCSEDVVFLLPIQGFDTAARQTILPFAGELTVLAQYATFGTNHVDHAFIHKRQNV